MIGHGGLLMAPNHLQVSLRIKNKVVRSRSHPLVWYYKTSLSKESGASGRLQKAFFMEQSALQMLVESPSPNPCPKSEVILANLPIPQSPNLKSQISKMDLLRSDAKLRCSLRVSRLDIFSFRFEIDKGTAHRSFN